MGHKRRTLVEGQVYLPRYPGRHKRRKFRRVIAVKDGMVFYSSGGDKNYFCSITSFEVATNPEPLDPVVASRIDSCEDLLRT